MRGLERVLGRVRGVPGGVQQGKERRGGGARADLNLPFPFLFVFRFLVLQEFFKKIKFKYLEQEAKEAFLRLILAEDPVQIDREDNNRLGELDRPPYRLVLALLQAASALICR